MVDSVCHWDDVSASSDNAKLVWQGDSDSKWGQHGLARQKYSDNCLLIFFSSPCISVQVNDKLYIKAKYLSKIGPSGTVWDQHISFALSENHQLPLDKEKPLKFRTNDTEVMLKDLKNKK